MGWFKRSKQNISPKSKKLDVPDGQWIKCEKCSEIIYARQLEMNAWVCFKCEHHFRIGSDEYISLLLDKNSFKELDKKMKSGDPLEFEDTKKYSDRITATIKKSGLNDAVKTGLGTMGKK